MRIREWMIRIKRRDYVCRVWLDMTVFTPETLSEIRSKIYDALDPDLNLPVAFSSIGLAGFYAERMIEKLGGADGKGVNAVEVLEYNTKDGVVVYPEWP